MTETPEERKARLREQLRLGREKAKANREAARRNAAVPAESDPAPIARVGKAPAPASTEGFEEFLLTLDRETRELLSIPKLMAIYEAGIARAEEERVKLVEKRAMERALGNARERKGLVPAAQADQLARQRQLAEKVKFTPDLPEIGDVGLRIDGQIILHGHEVTITRAQFESLREICWRNKQAELDFEGKSRLSQLRRAAPFLSVNLAGNFA